MENDNSVTDICLVNLDSFMRDKIATTSSTLQMIQSGKEIPKKLVNICIENMRILNAISRLKEIKELPYSKQILVEIEKNYKILYK